MWIKNFETVKNLLLINYITVPFAGIYAILIMQCLIVKKKPM
jgi:hypothetical protein